MKLASTVIATSLLALLTPGIANALHLDIVVSNQGGKLSTSFCLDGGPSCDRLQVLDTLGMDENELIDHSSGKQLFISDFGDFAGGPHAVDDPGFISGNGELPRNTLINYRAIGSLQYWDPSSGAWLSDVPGDARIRIYGGLDVTTVLSTDTSHCNGLLICIPIETSEDVYEAGSTLITDEGIFGAESLIIDNTNNNGHLHTHMDFFLEHPNGSLGGPDGAYLIELVVTAEGLEDSDPFLILFNHGLSTTAYAEALSNRVAISAVPVPAAVVFYASGLGLLALVRRRHILSAGA